MWTETTDYFQVVGIILGQLTVGFLGDWLGRRWGMIQVWDETLYLDQLLEKTPLPNQAPLFDSLFCLLKPCIPLTELGVASF